MNFETPQSKKNQESKTNHLDLARQLIEKSELLQKNPEIFNNWDGVEGLDLEYKGEDERKKLDGMIASGEISAEDVENLKNEFNTNLVNEKIIEGENIKQEFSDFLNTTGINEETVVTLELVYNRPATYKVVDIDKERCVVRLEAFGENSQILGIDREACFAAGMTGTFSLNSLKEEIMKNQPKTEKQDKDINDLIKNTNSLPELYKVIEGLGGIQGSSEFYSSDQLWERVRAYINNEANENVITKTGGLRDKVIELKAQREAKK